MAVVEGSIHITRVDGGRYFVTFGEFTKSGGVVPKLTVDRGGLEQLLRQIGLSQADTQKAIATADQDGNASRHVRIDDANLRGLGLM